MEKKGWEGGSSDFRIDKGTRYKVQGTRIKVFFINEVIILMSRELEERFENFAKNVRNFCQKLKWDIINQEYIRQLIRASSSIAANYIEASDDIGKADEKMKIKISSRESKESALFLNLILTYKDKNLESERSELIKEAIEIRKILSAILIKLEKR